LALAVALAVPPFVDNPAYFEFADRRVIFGIPHFGDVITNLALLAAGAAGLLFARKRAAFAAFFAGVFLTAFGSTWFHLDPNPERLFWDRLPMTLGFMGLFAAVIEERADLKLLAPLLAAGVAAVLYWKWTGDLRFYALVQFYPMLAIPLLLFLFPGPSTGHYWGAMGWYAAAKACEMLDRPIFEAVGLVSGHNLKHCLAAMSAAWILRMLALRQPARLNEDP
jgi:hypothetical protein